jgi:hypothetical protein
VSSAGRPIPGRRKISRSVDVKIARPADDAGRAPPYVRRCQQPNSEVSMNTRLALLAVALAFGIWEAIDTLDTGAPAAIFSVLFLGAAVALYRRSSRIAAIVIALLCSVEASQAHTWKDASTVAKDAAMALGSAGILAAGTFVARSLRTPNPPSLKGAAR